MIKSKAALLEEATHEVKNANDFFVKFAADIVKSPSYTLSWSGDAFKYAARHQVWSSIEKACVCDEVTLEHVTEEARRNVLRGAMYPEHSTSPASNLMAQEVTAAWAKALERLSK